MRYSFFLFLALPIFIMPPVYAQSQYVSDELEITLRSGPSIQNRILRMLKSGTKLEILSVNEDSGYAKVRDPEGNEGWVLTRFLMDQPSARERIIENNQHMAILEAENLKARAEMEKMDDLRRTITQLKSENQRLDDELSQLRTTAASALSLNQENTNLQEVIKELADQKETLTRENLILKDETAPRWFVRGAGVVLLGIVIGLILPKIRWKRRRSWGEF